MIHPYKDFTPVVDKSCFIAPGSAVIGNVEIGRNSSVWYNAVIRGDMAKVIIGENTNIQDLSAVHCSTNIETVIGNHVTVGHGVVLHSCTIGDYSLIGMGAVVLDGAVIGKNCLIGAGSVIVPNMKVPDQSLVMGNPGRIRRMLTEEEVLNMGKGSEVYCKLLEEYK
ncbi:MAG: gamma carbonic anhydrase family protein [Clostridia bacterium]|nr:gamma carbonic anhydrase family protein [Clostridia bacterium]